MTQKDINKNNLTSNGEMNLIMQIWGNINGGEAVKEQTDEEWAVTVDQYQPRKNRIWNGELNDKEELVANVKDTIERLKIGQQLLQDWLDGKTDNVYYWDLDKLPE